MALYTIFFAFAGVVIGILIFIYFNRHLQNKRDARREEMLERKQEFLDRLLESKKRHNSEPNDEVSDLAPPKLREGDAQQKLNNDPIAD